MVYYKIPLSGGLNYPAGCILICAYTYNGYEYCKFEKVTEVGSNWVSITESEFNIRCPEFPDPEYTGEMESAEYPGCYYRMVNGEKEWLNPPMVSGQEYRTTERHLGKPVYITSVTFSSIPTTKNESVYIESAIPVDSKIVDISGSFHFNDFFVYPHQANNSSGDIALTYLSKARNLNLKKYDVVLEAAKDMSENTKCEATVTIKYVKS